MIICDGISPGVADADIQSGLISAVACT